MAYNIELFEAAEQDLDDAIAWYVSESPATASRFVDAYLVMLDRLAENLFQFPNAQEKSIKQDSPNLSLSIIISPWYQIPFL